MIPALVAFLVAVAAGPVLAARADRLGLADDGGAEHRRHEGTLPRVGGIAVLAAAALGGVAADLPAVWALAVLPFALGLHDDLSPSDPRVRLVALVAIAALAWAGGLRVEALRLPGEGLVDLQALGPVVTVLWIVGVVVAFDFLDGLDGLAGGVGLIASLAFGVIAIHEGRDPAGAWVLAGALFGFLVHNRHPAKLQLGDAGSNLVGFLVAAAAIGAGGGGGGHDLVGAGLILGVPILDAGTTVVRRLRAGRLFESERGHLHHRLLARGLSHPRAVAALWGATLAGVACAVGLRLGGAGLIVPAVVLPSTLYVLLRPA